MTFNACSNDTLIAMASNLNYRELFELSVVNKSLKQFLLSEDSELAIWQPLLDKNGFKKSSTTFLFWYY